MNAEPPCIDLDPDTDPCPFCGAEARDPCGHPLSNPDPVPACYTPRDTGPLDPANPPRMSMPATGTTKRGAATT